MDLVGAYSNPSDQLERLRTLLELPHATRPERSPPPPKQAQKRTDVAELVAAYEVGGRVKKLAVQFGIHRTTVTDILQREGVALRPPGIHPDNLPEVIHLYREGWSLAELGRTFDVSRSTVTNTLRRVGEPLRRRQG